MFMNPESVYQSNSSIQSKDCREKSSISTHNKNLGISVLKRNHFIYFISFFLILISFFLGKYSAKTSKVASEYKLPDAVNYNQESDFNVQRYSDFRIYLRNTETPYDSVFICTGKYSRRYHLKRNCKGVSGCQGTVIKTALDQAMSKGRSLCGWED